MRRFAFTFAALVVAAPLPVFADGLVYSLPKDKTKVVYEMKGSKSDANDNEEFAGTISVASVGQKTVNEEKCRWIEIAMTLKQRGQTRTITAKMLITETDLGEGKLPLGNIKQAWLRTRNGDVVKIEDIHSRRGGPIPAFLPGPLSKITKLPPAAVQTEAGKFQCSGLTGKTEYEQGNENRMDRFEVDYRIRRSDKVPFGVVTAKITIREFVRKMRLDDTITLDLKLKSIDRNATSAIADKN